MFIIEAIGNLGADAAIRNVNGTSFMAFRIAATNTRRDASGNKIDTTTWISCTAAPSEKLFNYMKKGTQVFIRGKANLSIYNGKNGPSIDVSCRADELKLLSSNNTETNQKTEYDGY